VSRKFYCFFHLNSLLLLPVKKVGILGTLLLMAAVALLWFIGRPAYRRHREQASLAQAEAFFARDDFRNASLAARRALQLNPTNLAACALIADVGEKAKSPTELDWRRKIVDLAPTLDNQLKLAGCALRLQAPPYPLATQTLDQLAQSAVTSAVYHSLRAELALKLGDIARAAAEFGKASELEPANEMHRLNVAVLQLRSTNETVLAQARASLEAIAKHSALHEVALRWLVSDCARKGEFSKAASYSTQLLASTQVKLDDRLQHLTILQQNNPSAFADYISGVERDARVNATALYSLTSWMLAHKMADEAYVWLTNCPARIRCEQPAPLAMVDCLMQKRDWDGLEKFLQSPKWGEQEFLRFAFLSRAAEQENESLAADTRWRSAIRAAEDSIGPLTALLTAATTWGREKEREDVLWAIAERCPRERWSLTELSRVYQAQGNTRGLHRVYAAMANYDARNFVIKNNLAATSMLLKANLPDAHRLAREIYSQHPEESVIASTYAWSLHLQGRTREAIGVLERFKTNELQQPNVALYYGLLLSAAGDKNKAVAYLTIAQQTTLLPEEKALVSDAARQL
jgi:Flp pilus assembly protein TadD